MADSPESAPVPGWGAWNGRARRCWRFTVITGGVYFQRNYGFLPSTTPGASCAGVSGFTCVGFGFPGSDTTSNRTVQEESFGVIPTLWSSENYGKVQIITQYSYLSRNPWFVAPGNPRSAHLNMAYIDFRYTLP